MEAAADASPATAQFFPVHVDSINEDILEMDLYIRYGSDEPTLYRGRGVDFNDRERTRLVEQKIEFLYVPMTQHAQYREALGRRMERLFRNKDVSRAERTRLLRATCTRMVEDVMLFPGNAGAVGSVQEVGKIFARLIEENEGDFSYLLDMSEHDYYTTTHMVNVGVGCGLLVRTICQRDPARDTKVALAIQGGLLHDVGKRGVPESVLNKEGKLNDEEWAMIREHPSRGFEELKLQPNLDPTVLEMTRDHHERMDGKGYPAGAQADAISFPARVCAVVDVYDAITSARPYRGPIKPVEALRMMSEGSGTQFDQGIFAVWKAIVERLLKEDPKRIVRQAGSALCRAGRRIKRREPAEQPVLRGGGIDELPDRQADPKGAERRLYQRTACDIPAEARFERQMKATSIQPGESFRVRIKDISRGGVLIATPWPLSINDLLTVQFGPAEKPMRRRIRIVRVRRQPDGTWGAGACFIAQENQDSGERKAA